MLSLDGRQPLILLIRTRETSHEVDKTTVEIAFFPKRRTGVGVSAIEKRRDAIDRTDVFSTSSALEDDGRDNARSTLVFC